VIKDGERERERERERANNSLGILVYLLLFNPGVNLGLIK